MENQGQGWLRGAIIAGAIIAAIVYLVSRRNQGGPAEGAATAVSQTVEDISRSDLGKRSVRIGELMLANVADDAMGQVKGMLKDWLHQAEDWVDQL